MSFKDVLNDLVNSVEVAIQAGEQINGSGSYVVDNDIANDRGLMFVLDNIISTFHRQLEDNLRTRDGRTIQNIQDWYKSSEARMIQIMAKHGDDREGLTTDEDFLKAVADHKVNEAKYLGLHGMYTDALEVYHDTFNKPWQYRSWETTVNVNASQTEEQKAALEGVLAGLNAPV